MFMLSERVKIFMEKTSRNALIDVSFSGKSRRMGEGWASHYGSRTRINFRIYEVLSGEGKQEKIINFTPFWLISAKHWPVPT